MNRLSVILLLGFLVLGTAWAQSPGVDALWRNANAAYQSQDYETARDLYEKLAGGGMAQAGLFYNLGNAYYQLGQPGRAAWMYEKALALDPRHGDARHNLALARAGGAAPETEVLLLIRPFVWLTSRLTAGEWGVLFLIVYTWALGAAAAWLIARKSRWRRLLFHLMWTGAAATLLTAAFFVPRYIDAEWRDYGIVIESGAIVRSAPGADQPEYFEAMPGERLLISPSQAAGWYQVKRPSDGRVGFLPERTIGAV